MRRIRLVFAALAFVTWPAHATYHTWVIEQLYSNADGNVQFVVLHEAQGANGENLQGLIYIEYTFHATLILAGVILARFLWVKHRLGN